MYHHFLQLITCGLLEFKLRNKEVVVSLARDSNKNYYYKDRLCGDGFEFWFKERGFLHNFSEFLAYNMFEQLKVGHHQAICNRVTRE